MRYILMSIISVFLTTLKGQVVEKVFLEKGDQTTYAGTRVGKNLYFNILPMSDYLGYSTSSATLFKTDENLNIKDSIVISDALGLNHKATATRMERLSDSTIAFTMSGYQNYLFVIMDTSLNPLNYYTVDFGSDTIIGSFESFCFHNGDLILGGHIRYFANLHDAIPLITVLDSASGSRKKTVPFDSLYGNITDISKFNSTLHLSLGQEQSSYTFIGLNPGYELDSIHSYSNREIRRVSYLSKVLSNNQINSLGYEPRFEMFSFIKFDSTLNILHRDTFLTDDYTYLGNDNFAIGSDNSYFMGVTIDPVGFSYEFEPTLQRKITIYKIDQNGNKIWRKDFQDSIYRLVTQLIPSSDGGVFVISTTYDPKTYDSLKTDVSILKIDSSGNFVDFPIGLQKNSSKKPQLTKIYPNPNNGSFSISKPVENFQPYQVRVFTSNGKEVYNAIIKSPEYNLRLNQPSGYYFLVTDEKDFIPFIIE